MIVILTLSHLLFPKDNLSTFTLLVPIHLVFSFREKKIVESFIAFSRFKTIIQGLSYDDQVASFLNKA